MTDWIIKIKRTEILHKKVSAQTEADAVFEAKKLLPYMVSDDAQVEAIEVTLDMTGKEWMM